jgi:hypothetical protein
MSVLWSMQPGMTTPSPGLPAAGTSVRKSGIVRPVATAAPPRPAPPPRHYDDTTSGGSSDGSESGSELERELSREERLAVRQVLTRDLLLLRKLVQVCAVPLQRHSHQNSPLQPAHSPFDTQEKEEMTRMFNSEKLSLCLSLH